MMTTPMSIGLRVYDQRSPLAMCVGGLTTRASCPSFFSGNKVWLPTMEERARHLCNSGSDNQLMEHERRAQLRPINYDPEHRGMRRTKPTAYSGNARPLTKLLSPVELDSSEGQLSSSGEYCNTTHRDEALVARDADDRVVAAGSAGRRVYEEVDSLVDDLDGARLREHDVQMDCLENLLQGVEREPRELTLDEVWTVLSSSSTGGSVESIESSSSTGADNEHLHDSLELDVPVRALPPVTCFRGTRPNVRTLVGPWWTCGRKRDSPGDKMQHVHAVGSLSVGLACGAGQLDAEEREDWELCDLVSHAEQSRVEVDLGGQRADGQQRCVAHDQQRRDRLVEEPRVHIRRLLEDQDVSSSPLCR